MSSVCPRTGGGRFRGTLVSLLSSALCLLAFPAGSTAGEGPDIYVEVGKVVETRDEWRVDVVVGNRGGSASRANFDAFLEITSGEDKPVCSKATNFVTPLGPGHTVATFRFRLRKPGANDPSTLYTLSTHTHFWDDHPGNDQDRRNNQQKVSLSWPAGGIADCSLLKPIQ